MKQFLDLSLFFFVLRRLSFSYKRRRTPTLSPECKFDEADFTDWMSVPPSNLLDDTSSKSDVSAQIQKSFHQYGIAEKTKMNSM